MLSAVTKKLTFTLSKSLKNIAEHSGKTFEHSTNDSRNVSVNLNHRTSGSVENLKQGVKEKRLTQKDTKLLLIPVVKNKQLNVQKITAKLNEFKIKDFKPRNCEQGFPSEGRH